MKRKHGDRSEPDLDPRPSQVSGSTPSGSTPVAKLGAVIACTAAAVYAMHKLLLFISIPYAITHAKISSSLHAHTYREAVRKTGESLAIVGPIAFGCSAAPLLLSRQPRAALTVGLRSAQRWGGTSAGFSGGRAFCQVARRTDDVWCAVAGGIAAGLLGSPSVALIPARVASFAGLSILIESQLIPRLQEGTSGAQATAKPKPKRVIPLERRTSDSGHPLAQRAPWGSRTPWADKSWMKAISRFDQGRQDFEDRCVAWLAPSASPSR